MQNEPDVRIRVDLVLVAIVLGLDLMICGLEGLLFGGNGLHFLPPMIGGNLTGWLIYVLNGLLRG